MDSIVGSYDQPLSVDAESFLSRLDEYIEQSIKEKSPDKLFNIALQLRKASQLSGIGLAKVIWYLKRSWKEFETNGDFYEEAAIRLGVQPHTVDRYASVWSMFERQEIPKEFELKFKERNIKELVPIAKALEQGYEIDGENWKQLNKAPDFSTVSKKIRDIKGKPPRKGSMQLFLERDGSINANSNGQVEIVGWLDVGNENDIVQNAIKRISNSSGMIAR